MQSRYDAVLSALNAGVVIHAADTHIVDANERARTLLGLQDLEGRLATDPDWVFLEADHAPMTLERFPVMQVIATHQPLRDMTMIIQPPGQPEVWLEVNAAPIFTPAGQLDQVAVTFIDVTERTRAEDMLARQAERLELVLSASQLGMWDWNMATDEAVVDRQWATALGYQVADVGHMTGEFLRSLVHPDDRAAADAMAAEHAAGRVPVFDVEYRIRHHDGHWEWVRDRGRIIEWAADGRPLRMIGTQENVSAAHRAAAVLAAAEEESRLAFDRSRVATCLVANDGRIIRVNPALCDLLGRSETELLALSFLDVTHPEDVDVGMDQLGEMLAGRQQSARLTKRYVTGAGRVIWGDVTISVVLDEDGSVRHRIAQILDVTQEHSLRESLMETQRIAHMGGWKLDLATGHVEWSPELFALFGLEPRDTAPDYVDQERLMTPESWQRLSTAVEHARETGTPYELEAEIVQADGSHRWLEARGEAVRDASGAIVELHGISMDITDRKAARDELRALATHDPLTGLANRAALIDEVTRAMGAGRRSGRATAILMMDLDRFKVVNDTLGHAAGDELLVTSATRLQEVVRAGDLVARLGGDEFVVVMRDLADPNEAVHAAGRLVQAFQAPFTVGGHEVFTTASVGVAIATEGGQVGDLLREADTAMYAAKEAGRDRVSMYNEDLRTAATTRMAIEADLRHALARGQLAVWYQPEVDLADGTVTAVEALLRWHHPDGTVWTADRFVDVAEDTGLILDIGDWVLRQACTQGAAWTASRPDRPLTVRVNVSALQLAEAGLLEAIDDALAASGLDPHRLCVEITETALLRRTSITAGNLAGVHERGISLAIDDFGTGYASLTYLSQYPVDTIKIDRSFIPDATGQGLVAGIIALATTLGMTVTAEGVEHQDQATRLRQMGCPTAQGWLYSRAVPAEDVPGLLDVVFPHS